MTEDRSLEDFVGGSDDEGDDAAESADASESVDESEPADAPDDEDDAGDAPGPAVATYRWDPDGVECAACGESVERVWTADADGSETFVCESCKEW
ncbi:DUF7573 domain-containing protein [Halopelagius fulvigenes]|uniref:DUF7573 domain-containing protein n=1 Tax=Halopelagius fulvigenes TaxID=1198324 RepID=A0ABD5TUY6_9EURY